MKMMKKLAGIALAMVMALALMVPAFADDGASITVENADKGETYKLVKLFDATYNKDTGAIVYSGTVPTDLDAYFKADNQGYITAKDEATGEDGKLSSAAVEAIKKWAEGQSGTEITADGGPVVFTGLDYGYYVVVSRSTSGGAVSVTSAKPNATVVDKNTGNTPTDPSKSANGKVFGVGDTVTYTVTYSPLNWIGDGDDAEQVVSYTISDTLPGFLTDVNVKSITLKNAKNETVETWDKQFVNRAITLDWAEKGALKCEEDHDHTEACYAWTSKYPSGCTLEIVYAATVTDKIAEAGSDNHKNEVTVTYNTTGTPGSNTTDEDIYTATITIDKFASGNENQKLAGAQFVLKNEKSKYYKLVETTGEDGTTTWTVQWVENLWTDETNKVANATIAVTDANGSADFKGLAAGTYKLVEIEAPAGYNKLDKEKEIKVDADDVTENVSLTEKVENKSGSLLPSTGGIGTTIFYIGGGILVVGAAILLITKKRMGSD